MAPCLKLHGHSQVGGGYTPVVRADVKVTIFKPSFVFAPEKGRRDSHIATIYAGRRYLLNAHVERSASHRKIRLPVHSEHAQLLLASINHRFVTSRKASHKVNEGANIVTITYHWCLSINGDVTGYTYISLRMDDYRVLYVMSYVEGKRNGDDRYLIIVFTAPVGNLLKLTREWC